MPLKNAFSFLVAWAERRRSLLLVWAIGAVFAGGVVYSVWLGDRLRYPDEVEYYTLAQNLATRHSFTFDGVRPSAFRPPGYPLFLAGFVLLGANIEFLRVLNFAALCGCMYLTFAILDRRSGPLAGLFGALLVAGYPVLFYAAGTLYPQILGSLLLLGGLHLLLNSPGASRGPYVLAGLLLGLLLLFIPSFLFTLGIAAGWVSVARPRLRLRVVSLTLLTAFLVAGLWSVRNYRVFGQFVYVSANSGLNLLLGNSEYATATSGVNANISRYCTATGNDVEVDACYRDVALQYIRTHKQRVAGLYLLKVLNYFNFRNDLATASERSDLRDIIMLLSYGPLLLILVLRLLLCKRFPLSSFDALLVFVYLSNALYAAVFFTRVRLRLPLDFLLIIVVAAFLADRIAVNRIQTESEASAKASAD